MRRRMALAFFAIVFQNRTPPRALLPILSPTELENWVEIHRKPACFVTPVLEQRCSRAQERFGKLRVETAQSGHEDQRVAPRARDGDGVELQVAEALDDGVASEPLFRTGARGKYGPLGLQ